MRILNFHAARRRPPFIAAAVLGLAVTIGTMPPPALTAAPAADRPVLWRDPGAIGRRDLFWGATSETRAPRAPFTFIKEDSSGSKPKLHVRDAGGMTWSVKFDRRSGRGREIPAEIAASRIAWALGYFVEETYLVADGAIAGAGTLERGKRVLDARGRFALARFEPRPDDVERLDLRWTIADNPFTGTRELSGLVVLAALVNDWDFRAGNTTALRVPTPDGHETRYLVSDWGTAFGRMPPRRSRWNLEHYLREPQFFTIRGDQLELNLNADDAPQRTQVPLTDARWFAGLAAQLSVDQLRQAFAAGGATPEERDGFADAVRARIVLLHDSLQAPGAGTTAARRRR